MRNLFRLSALLIVAMLAIVGSRGASSVAAQIDPLSGMGSDLDKYEGIQEAAGRFYSPNMDMLMASPDASMDGMTGVQGGLFAVLRFDNGDNAEAALEQFRGEFQSSMEQSMEGATMEEIDRDDVDDDSIAFKVTQSDDTLGALTTVAIMDQDDEYIYLSMVIAIGEGEDPTDLAVAIANDMESTDAGDGEATFNEDGTSEGGIWDKLPDADAQDGAFGGMTATDEQLYPTHGTPES